MAFIHSLCDFSLVGYRTTFLYIFVLQICRSPCSVDVFPSSKKGFKLVLPSPCSCYLCTCSSCSLMSFCTALTQLTSALNQRARFLLFQMFAPKTISLVINLNGFLDQPLQAGVTSQVIQFLVVYSVAYSASFCTDFSSLLLDSGSINGVIMIKFYSLLK